MKFNKDSKILFVCTANLMRSKTGEDVFLEKGFKNVKSAGTMALHFGKNCEVCFHSRIPVKETNCPECQSKLPNEKVQLTKEHINWADIVFVMEEEHLDWIKNNLDCIVKNIEVLDIPDNFERGDPTLKKCFAALADKAEYKSK